MVPVIGGLVSVHYNATADVSCAIQVQATALSANRTTIMEIHVNTIATLDVLIKCVTIQRANAFHVLVDIGDRFVTLPAAVGVRLMDAIVHLENVMHARVKLCTATSVEHAVIIVPIGNVTRMETAHRAV